MSIPFPRGFIARVDLVPTTNSIGTIYWAMRNTGSEGQQLYIKRVTGIVTFGGLVGLSRSILGFHRKTGTATGGTVTPPLLLNSGSPTGLVDCRFDNDGLGGLTIGTNDRFHIVPIMGQNAQANFFDLEFEDENPCIIEVGENLVIYAHTVLVAGTGMHGSCLFYGNSP